MSETYFEKTSKVSRDMDVADTAYDQVIWIEGNTPLDSELNLIAQLSNDKLKTYISQALPTGFLIDPVNSKLDFIESPTANTFSLRPCTFSLNGELLKISDYDSTLKVDKPLTITLSAPAPATRTDLVYLEVWKKVIKDASSIKKFGNQDTQDTLNSQIVDPDISPTTHRVQLQYKLKVKDNVLDVGLKSTSPQGPIVGNFFQGTYGDPDLVTKIYTATLTDAEVESQSLATNKIYAIPLCKIHRRTNLSYSDISASNPNTALNGTGDRPDGLSATGIKLSDIKDLRVAVSLPNDLTSYLKKSLFDIFQRKLLTKTVSSQSVSGAYKHLSVDLFGGATTNTEYASLDLFSSGRSLYSDGVHEQDYDLYLEYLNTKNIKPVNGVSANNWGSEATIDAALAFTTDIGHLSILPQYCFVKLNYKNIQPKKELSSQVGRNILRPVSVETYGQGAETSTQLPVAYKRVWTGGLTFTAGLAPKPAGETWVPGNHLVVIPGKGCFPVLITGSDLDLTTYTLIGTSYSETVTGVEVWDMTVPSTLADVAITPELLIYNKDTTSKNLGNVKVKCLIYNSPGFSKVPLKVHHLKLTGAGFTTLLQPSVSNVYKYTPRPLSQWYKSPPNTKPNIASYQSSLFVDPSSKTILFQPYQSGKFDLYSGTPTTTAPAPFSSSAHPFTNTFSNVEVYLPEVCRIPEGWMDIPYVSSTNRGDKIPFGYNYLFGDISTNITDSDNTLWFIGGSDNTALKSALFSTTNTLADLGAIGSNQFDSMDTVQVWHTDLNDQSQPPIEGLKFPANIAPARIYAVYDVTPVTPTNPNPNLVSSSLYTNRKTLNTVLNGDASKNLLSKDLTVKTLYREGNHFYIPKELISGYKNDRVYVIEAMVFAFKDSKRIYLRKNKASSTYTNLLGCSMLFFGPSTPLDSTNTAHVVYDSAPYQGTNDWTGKDIAFAPPSIPATPVPDYYEVLDSVGFYTTLGSGKVPGNNPFVNGKIQLKTDLSSVREVMQGTSSPYLSPILSNIISNIPLGALVKDNYFTGEKLGASHLEFTSPDVIYMGPEQDYYADSIQYPRAVVGKGSVIGLLKTADYTASSSEFKIRRGYGSAFALVDGNQAVPLEWYNGEIMPPPSPPTSLSLYPNILSCKAFLVRDIHNNIKVVVCSYAHLQTDTNNPLVLKGIISPVGHGHGFASVDVFDLEGNPVHTGKPFITPTGVNLTKISKPPLV
jgi:hypothetical protein